jgi:hypothetical protein
VRELCFVLVSSSRLIVSIGMNPDAWFTFITPISNDVRSWTNILRYVSCAGHRRCLSDNMSDVGNKVLSDAVLPRVRRKRSLARATAGH